LISLTLFVSILSISTAQAQTTAEEFLKRGISSLENKKYIEAEENFNKAVELDPKMPEAYFWRAQVQLDDKKALADEEKAVQIGPPKID